MEQSISENGSGQNSSEQQINKMPVDFLSEDALKERGFDLNKVYMISQVRESPHPQFDDMSYLKYNETNEMADMSFLPRKKNKGDTRLTSGITHEKDSTIVAMVQGFNFETNIHCYYQGKELYDFSTIATSWVRKTREDEKYDEKRPINYRNLIVQGTAFVREKFVESYIPDKILADQQIDFAKLDEVRWTMKGMKKVTDGPRAYLVDGKKVFMEDIRQQDKDLQPGIYTVEYVPREIIAGIFGKNKRWLHVPKECNGGTAIGMITHGTIYSDWTFAEVDRYKIEVIEAFRPFENRYQIYLNGVPMLPVGFPLTAISPSGLIPIAKGDIDPMNLFAYSKSIPAKTKIDQQVYDQMIRLMLMKAEQAARIPSVNNTGKVLSSDIYMPGRMNQGFDANKIQPLMENPGIQQFDFNFTKFLKENMDNKSISAILEGGDADTATLGEYMDKQKKAMVKIGGIFDAVINWEKQMAHLRFTNLLANGARPLTTTYSSGAAKTVYKDVSFPDSFADDGTEGVRTLKFNGGPDGVMPSPYQVHADEIGQEKQGNNVRYAYIDPVVMKQMLTDSDYYFCYEIIPVDKNNDKLTKALFIGTITQAMQLFGPDSLNVEKLKRRYASVMGEQFDDLFLSPQDLQLKQQQAQQAAIQAQANGQDVPPPTNTASNVAMPTSNPLATASNVFQ